MIPMTPETAHRKPGPDLNRSFLLRVWKATRHSARASLTDVNTGEVHVFADLDKLSRWLETNCDLLSRKDV